MTRPRTDTRSVYPIARMLTEDVLGCGLPSVMPSTPEDLDALARRLDVMHVRAYELGNAAKLHAEDLRSQAARIRREEARVQSVAARIGRGELCAVVWAAAPEMAHADWHLVAISEDAHMVIDAGFGRSIAYSMRRAGYPADRDMRRGRIDVGATIVLWRAFCAARKHGP